MRVEADRRRNPQPMGRGETVSDDTTFDQWAIIELMGHIRMAGKVTEQEIAGTTLLRIDVPEKAGRGAFTTFVGASAIYRLTPTTEDVACALGDSTPDPVHPWDVRERLLQGEADAGQ